LSHIALARRIGRKALNSIGSNAGQVLVEAAAERKLTGRRTQALGRRG
jgi:hypothetical protein